MLDLIKNPQALGALSSSLVPILVLIASFLGSSHCVSMCGGIVMALPAGRLTQTAYHLGRLLGYLSLGALAGWAGQSILNLGLWLTRVSSLLMAAVMLHFAYQLWRGRSVHLPLPSFVERWLQTRLGEALVASRKAPWKGLLVGLLSMFLPCAWLYTFVLGALLTQSYVAGALFLFAFWLGTVPLLALGPALLQRWLKNRSLLQRQIVASLFIVAGMITVLGKWNTPLPIGEAHLDNPAQSVEHAGHGGHHHAGHGGHH